MRRSLVLLIVIMAGLAMLLAACDNGGDEADPVGDNELLGLFDWERDPNTIVVRLDSIPNQDSPAAILNRIPPCTLWGDGRLVWTTSTGLGSEDVLEARLDDVTIREFLQDIVARGFYNWEDDLLPPATFDSVVETITVNVSYGEPRTVQRYSVWPQNGFNHILDKCQGLATQPVRVLPESGWISAYEIPYDAQAPMWDWPPDVPFSLAELAESGEQRWVEGIGATRVWVTAREEQGDLQAIERGEPGKAYEVAIVVPGISRDAPPPPEEGEGAVAP